MVMTAMIIREGSSSMVEDAYAEKLFMMSP